MIIELLGLPGSGKTSISGQLEQKGWTIVRVTSRSEMLGRFFIYTVLHPVRVVLHGLYIVRYAGSFRMGYMKCMNLFIRAYAQQQKAEALPRAVIDQGVYQNIFSLFETVPAEKTLTNLVQLFPDNMLIMPHVDEALRQKRLRARTRAPREEYGEEAAMRFAQVSADVAIRISALLQKEDKELHEVSGEATLNLESLFSAVTYATFARMPTEKAHGVSIAHMCHAFAEAGLTAELVIPARSNDIEEDVFSYYRIPNNFTVTTISIIDFLGRGLRSSFFFLLQRIFFVQTLKRQTLSRIIYTRDPEVVWFFSKTHITVFEAHRMPQGIAGWLTSWMTRRADLVVCNSEGTQAAFDRGGAMASMKAPNGFRAADFENPAHVAETRQRLNIDTEKPVALYVGSLEAWKGVGTFFEAAHDLAERGIQSVVIGGNDQEVASLAKQYPAVQFVGFRPYHELGDNLAAANVLILPNTQHDVQSLSFTSPIKMFAYMAAEKPIVASDLPSIREVLNDKNSILVAPDDPDALAKGVERAVISDDIEVLVRNAKELSRTYTWSARARRIVQKLHSVI